MTAEREGVAEIEQHIEVLRELRDDYHLCGPTEYSEALDAAIRALRQGGGWLPIESAPKDGTGILAYWANDTALDERSYGVTLYGARCWLNPDNYGESYGDPTHWQPLPAPPSPAKEG